MIDDPQGPDNPGVKDGLQVDQQAPGVDHDSQDVLQNQGVEAEDTEPITEED